MATSFTGWGTSWVGWGTQVFDPNAMVGSATLTLSAVGTLTDAMAPADTPCPWGTSRRIRVMRKKRENDEALLLFVL